MRPPFPSTCRNLSRGASLVVALTGLGGLLGWILDNEALKGVFQGGVTIKPNAAIGLLLAAGALWGLREPTAPRLARVGRGCAIACVLLGGATLWEHVSGADLGIDQLIFREPPGEPGTVSPGRMGPPASINLVLAGIAMLLAYTGGTFRVRTFQILATLVCAIALIPLIGYAHAASELYSSPPYTGIALHTAVALFALGFGLLLSRPTVGYIARFCAGDAGGLLARRMVLPVLFLPFAIAWLRGLADSTGLVSLDVSRPLSILLLTAAGVALVLITAASLSRLDHERARGEHRLRTVFEAAPVLLANLDQQGRQVLVNSSYARQFGGEPESFVGRRFEETVGPDVFLQMQHALSLALRGERAELDLQLAGGAEGDRYLHAILAPERGADGSVHGVVAAMIDITDRKTAETEAGRSRDEALAAARAKDEFIAMLSHELRTPLNPVMLVAGERENDPELPAELRADFAQIRKHVEQEARLIDDLLDISRVMRGKLALELTKVCATAVLTDAVALAHDEASAKGLRVNLRLPERPVMMRADVVRLQQIFWNVVKNAVKFTPRDGRVDVSAETHAGDLVVVVEDTGIGMTESELERAFQPFSQGDHKGHADSYGFGGLGLGLAISQLLTTMHGGRIVALSPGRGKGATIRITLPLKTAGGREGASASPPEEVRQALRTVPAAGLKVLLVEDHEATRDTLVNLLRKRGFTVMPAGSITEALLLARVGTFDLLISDLGLPDGDGCELITALRVNDSVPGIAMTGYGMEADRARTMAAGFVTHLTKPVSVNALDAAIVMALGPDRVRPAGSSAP